jgi:hypothetical protein
VTLAEALLPPLPVGFAVAAIVLACLLGVVGGVWGALRTRDWRIRGAIDELWEANEALSVRLARREGAAGAATREAKRSAGKSPADIEAEQLLSAAAAQRRPPKPSVELVPNETGDTFDLPANMLTPRRGGSGGA